MVIVLQPLGPYISQKALYQQCITKSIFVKTSATPWGYLYTTTTQETVQCYSACVVVYLFLFLLVLFRREDVLQVPNGCQMRVDFLTMTQSLPTSNFEL